MWTKQIKTTRSISNSSLFWRNSKNFGKTQSKLVKPALKTLRKKHCLSKLFTASAELLDLAETSNLSSFRIVDLMLRFSVD